MVSSTKSPPILPEEGAGLSTSTSANYTYSRGVDDAPPSSHFSIERSYSQNPPHSSGSGGGDIYRSSTTQDLTPPPLQTGETASNNMFGKMSNLRLKVKSVLRPDEAMRVDWDNEKTGRSEINLYHFDKLINGTKESRDKRSSPSSSITEKSFTPEEDNLYNSYMCVQKVRRARILYIYICQSSRRSSYYSLGSSLGSISAKHPLTHLQVIKQQMAGLYWVYGLLGY